MRTKRNNSIFLFIFFISSFASADVGTPIDRDSIYSYSGMDECKIGDMVFMLTDDTKICGIPYFSRDTGFDNYGVVFPEYPNNENLAIEDWDAYSRSIREYEREHAIATEQRRAKVSETEQRINELNGFYRQIQEEQTNLRNSFFNIFENNSEEFDRDRTFSTSDNLVTKIKNKKYFLVPNYVLNDNGIQKVNPLRTYLISFNQVALVKITEQAFQKAKEQALYFWERRDTRRDNDILMSFHARLNRGNLDVFSNEAKFVGIISEVGVGSILVINDGHQRRVVRGANAIIIEDFGPTNFLSHNYHFYMPFNRGELQESFNSDQQRSLSNLSDDNEYYWANFMSAMNKNLARSVAPLRFRYRK